MDPSDKKNQTVDGYDPSNDCCKQEKFNISFFSNGSKEIICHFIKKMTSERKCDQEDNLNTRNILYYYKDLQTILDVLPPTMTFITY